MTIKIYEVGGCVRDEILGIPSKDIDFVVVAPSFDAMKQHLATQGFKTYLETPEFVTLRCAIPQNHPLRQRAKDADFVLARKDSPTSDGRRPDYVEPGTLEDDLSRRDFTANSLARDPETGQIIDLFGGVDDVRNQVLKFVGDPMQRIREDGLRVLRGLRFQITKGFQPSLETWNALRSDLAATMLQRVSLERVREELEKMLLHDTLGTITLMAEMPPPLQLAIFRAPLRLSATLKGK